MPYPTHIGHFGGRVGNLTYSGTYWVRETNQAQHSLNLVWICSP